MPFYFIFLTWLLQVMRPYVNYSFTNVFMTIDFLLRFANNKGIKVLNNFDNMIYIDNIRKNAFNFCLLT